MNEKYGAWAFTAGIVFAIILGFINISDTWPAWVLIFLGLVVGFVNVTEKESTAFLVGAVTLVITAGALTQLPAVGSYVSKILANVIALVSPAAIVVAFKAIWELGGKK